MTDNSLNKSKEILKKLEDIMKCKICNTKYDYNIHRPMIVKCGHTFCKNCINNYFQKLSNNRQYKREKSFICPIDGIQHIFNSENINTNESTIYPNLKLEIILKEILHITEPTIKEKYIASRPSTLPTKRITPRASASLSRA